ncbi:MAG: ATP-binding protein [Planctomycetota bacterium]
MPALHCDVREVQSPEHRRAHHLRFRGIISNTTLGAFRQSLRAPAESGLDLIIDLSEVGYINSSGIGEILRLGDGLQVRGGRLVVVCRDAGVLRLLDLLGLTTVFHVTPDLNRALAAVDSDAPPMPPEEAVEAREQPKRPRPGAVPRLPEARIVLGFGEDTRFTKFLRTCFSGPERPAMVARDRNAFARLLGEGRIDLVILDSELPDFAEICALLKTDATNGLVSIVTIYSENVDGHEVHTFRVMEDDFVVEPFEMREIVALIEAEYTRQQEAGAVFRQEAKLAIPSDARDIVEATETIENMLAGVAMSDADRNAFLYAVREAIDNARRHGNKGDPRRRIDAHYTLDREAVSILVEDQGEGFDYRSYVDNANQTTPVEQARKRHQAGAHGGLGINLMLRCCDGVEYEGDGNRVRLTKRI